MLKHHLQHAVNDSVHVEDGAQVRRHRFRARRVADVHLDVQGRRKQGQGVGERDARPRNGRLHGRQRRRVDTAGADEALEVPSAFAAGDAGGFKVGPGQTGDEVIAAAGEGPVGIQHGDAVAGGLNEQAQKVARQAAARDEVAAVILLVVVMLSGRSLPVGGKVGDFQRHARERRNDMVAEVDAANGAQARVEQLEVPAAGPSGEDATRRGRTRNHLGAKRGEDVKVNAESGEVVDLEGQMFAVVLYRERHVARDEIGRFGRNGQACGRVAAAAVELDGVAPEIVKREQDEGLGRLEKVVAVATKGDDGRRQAEIGDAFDVGRRFGMGLVQGQA